MSLDYPLWFKAAQPDLAKVSLPELNDYYYTKLKPKEFDTQPDFKTLMVGNVLSSMQSGNFQGWRQYRKTQKDEHIGQIMP